jgi:hypothetical protein
MQLDGPGADRVAAVILFALGIGMLAGGYAMDRLEIRQIHPASIPGLVPMLLGGILAVCAALLYRGAGREVREPPPPAGSTSWADLGAALVLTLGYALGLVGRVPFFWATALFIAAFAAWFAWPARGEGRARAIVRAAGFGLVAAGAISALFRYGFLVRLP